MHPIVRRQSIADVLRRTAQRLPGKTGIVCGATRWTYAEFDALVTRLAAGLAQRGIRPGEHVAMLARNSHGFAAMRFALARLGAVMVPINPDYGVAEAHYVLGHAEVCGVVCSAEAWPTVEQACAGLQQRPWCLLNAAPADAREAETPGGIELLDDLLEKSVQLVGKPVAMMNKDDKVRAIAFLNEAGALLITKSGDKIAKYFGISKYTLYSYLDCGADAGK